MCYGLNVVGKLVSLLCEGDASGLLEGFSNCFGECFIILFEFFFRHDDHLVGILYLLKCGYVVLVECFKVLCWILLFFSREGGVVWVGALLDFEWDLLDRKGLVMGIDVGFKFPFEEEESFGCGRGGGALKDA